MKLTGKIKIFKVNQTDKKAYAECGDTETFEKFTLVLDQVPPNIKEGAVIDFKDVECSLKNGKYAVMVTPNTQPKGGEQ